jgi:uncharacterized membrane protein
MHGQDHYFQWLMVIWNPPTLIVNEFFYFKHKFIAPLNIYIYIYIYIFLCKLKSNVKLIVLKQVALVQLYGS